MVRRRQPACIRIAARIHNTIVLAMSSTKSVYGALQRSAHGQPCCAMTPEEQRGISPPTRLK